MADLIQVLMPMAGFGKRFQSAGYSIPKPLIEVDGRSMFLRAMESLAGLPLKRDFVAVIRSEDDNRHGLGRAIKLATPRSQVVLLDESTRGPLETCLRAREYINPRAALIILDCDLEFRSQSYVNLVTACCSGRESASGVLLLHKASDSRFSFAQVEGNRVTRTAEKQAISPFAIAGAYFFKSAARFFEVAKERMEKMPGNTGEYFISETYNTLIAGEEIVLAAPIDTYRSFGTPEDLEKTKKNLND